MKASLPLFKLKDHVVKEDRRGIGVRKCDTCKVLQKFRKKHVPSPRNDRDTARDHGCPRGDATDFLAQLRGRMKISGWPRLTIGLTERFRTWGTCIMVLLALNGCQVNSLKSDFGSSNRAKAIGLPTGAIPGTEQNGGFPQGHLDPNKKTHVLIEVDGGGIMGITPALVLADLENQLRAKRKGFEHKHLRDIVSVFSGTSTGAILVGMLEAGMPADSIAKYYTTTGVALFNSKGRTPFPIFPLLLGPQFQRQPFQESFYTALRQQGVSEHITLNDLYHQPLLLIAAYDLCSKRTLWFRTRELDDQPLQDTYEVHNGRIQLVDAISASSLSAAFYFGKLPAPDLVWDYWQSNGNRQLMRGAVFNDGGQGTENNTLGVTTLQVILRDWANRVGKDDQVVIISLGCGNDFTPRTYGSASMLSNLGQVFAFFGNQAREESTVLQLRAAAQVARLNPNFRIYRFDYVPPRGSSAFSAAKAKDYEKAATDPQRGLIHRADYQRLVDDLCDAKISAVGPMPPLKLANPAHPTLRGF